MINFKKFPSLDQCRQKVIDHWTDKRPSLETEEFILTEKIDGANFCIVITADEVQCQKRSSLLGHDASFFNFQETLSQYDLEIQFLQAFVREKGIEVLRVYAEIFGEGIQNRVWYGKGKKILPFEVWIDERPLCYTEAMGIFTDIGINYWWTPVIAVVPSLAEAVIFDVEKVESKVITEGENLLNQSKYIEGVVIAPKNAVYTLGLEGEESLFRVKKKSVLFDDVSAKKQKVEVFKGSESFQELLGIFMNHFNDNRLKDLISKLGELEDIKQLGDYIKAFTVDAREDFLKVHMDQFKLLDDKEKKQLFKQGNKKAVPLLRALL